MGKYFDKVFIANRGEIACRAIRPLRELGITSVVGFSECDRLSLAVRMADEAYLLGPSPSPESYLNASRIIAVAAAAGCDALFPGYGFLAENADFADAVEAAGMTWIGPPGKAIRVMGDKANARRALVERGLPVTPGIEDVKDAEQIRVFAEEAGYPVLIKPVSGGGGKGMFEINSADEIQSALDTSRSVAAKAFGDDRIYVEKLILQPSHIEFQFLCDSHGNGIHLGERECSVQRNHQKLIEEAPSTKLSVEQRNEMGEKVARAMADLGYVTAGTMEFLLDPGGQLYAMEVNTRIQVEHTVTEMVTGVDLIRQMIFTAAGNELRLTQDDVRLDGHAIQCRINAEDPRRGFAPSFGTIEFLVQGVGPFIRNDTGVYQGWEVPPYYDSLLTKVCAQGSTRANAIERLKRVLSEFRIKGVKTTVPMHELVLSHPVFADGSYDTSFMDRYVDVVTDYEEEEGLAEISKLAALVAEITAKGVNPYNR